MTAPQQDLVRSPLSDGQWHRPHPLTPLLRGGLTLIVVLGIVLANLRDRLVAIVLPVFDPAIGDDYERWNESSDPLDWLFANNLLPVAGLAVVGALVVLIVAFTLAWRFHTFRITGDDVEVRRGILFRSHRRAPLDRVQGVNLTRPFVARLLGLAKLEVVGAGLDANVRLEYLRTVDAETIRADILRLASGLQLGGGADAAARPSLGGVVAKGITGLVEGDEAPVAAPDSVVQIPVRRLILAHLFDTTTVVLAIAAIAAVVLAAVGSFWVLFAAVPAVLGMGAYQVRLIARESRYAIAPTADGLRITFGLLTSVTETIPPGRIHAVEVSQPLLWRAAGWWAVRINRVNGRGAADATTDQFTTVLPVGTAADVHRVLRLVLDRVDDDIVRVGLGMDPRGAVPAASDPFTTTPRRAWFLRPLSWRRNGMLVTADALVVRRGLVWRKLALVPLARLQSVAVAQGPLARAVGVAALRAHTVTGPVHTGVGAIDREAALAAWHQVADGAVAAASVDRSHRWAQEEA